jgi:effector-binding domain-containing protein
MIDTPQIINSAAQPAAVIRVTIPKDQIRQVMGPAIQEVLATAAAQGIGPAGPVFSRHFRFDPEVWDFEVGVPVRGPVSPAGRVRAGELPEAKVLRTVYHGGYEGLGGGWVEFETWIKANGHATRGDFWERYLTDPASNPDPATYQTELNRPLAG